MGWLKVTTPWSISYLYRPTHIDLYREFVIIEYSLSLFKEKDNALNQGYQFRPMSTKENLLGKMYVEGTLTSKSRNSNMWRKIKEIAS